LGCPCITWPWANLAPCGVGATIATQALVMTQMGLGVGPSLSTTQMGWVWVEVWTQWGRGLGPCPDLRSLGPSQFRPQRGWGGVEVRTQGGWGLGPCPDPRAFGCGFFAVMSQDGRGMGPWPDLIGLRFRPFMARPGSVCFGFEVCVRIQDSWVSTPHPT
jgi:hypothetical protein